MSSDIVIRYATSAFTLSIAELIWTFGLSVAIAVAMSIISRFLYKHLWKEYGKTGVMTLIYVTALGTVIHELSHVLMCVIFDHRVTKISLFNPEPDGTLGYVENEYNVANDYQAAGNFFIGIAPIIMAGLSTYLLTRWLMPDIVPLWRPTHDINMILLFVSQIYHNLLVSDNLINWHFYAYIALVFIIAGHATLSMADMKGALTGVVALILTVFLINLVILWIPGLKQTVFDFLVKYYGIFYASMLFGLSLYVGLMVILLIAKIVIKH